jgi:hypothetical protein
LIQTVCIVGLLLSKTSMASAEIPLPRPRPADIPGDAQSSCQQQLGGFAEFKPLPPITGPGECLANDVVALNSVSLPDKHHVVLSPPATLRCPMAQTVALWLRDEVASHHDAGYFTSQRRDTGFIRVPRT